jgi:hypothetical protein
VPDQHGCDFGLQIARFSEIRTKARKMTLKSAIEDVIGTTLAAVSGVLGKLEYLSRLRRAKGNPYTHWGLGRAYGEAAAQEALAEAHRLLFLRVLQTPLKELQNDVEISSEASQMKPEEYVENLRGDSTILLPQDLGGGSARHFSSVLHALLSLASHQKTRTPKDATPPI